MSLKFIAACLDVSRNSVLKMDEIKKFIDLLPKMGYNMCALYTEDLYEMPEYEMFGYMRGKYSKDDLKELVAYAKERGVTMYPTIEVLAHLEHIFRWEDFKDIRDLKNILLVDEPKTYELIENMVKTMREIYDTNFLGMSCDEANMLGLGKFLKKHGYEDPKSIFARHLDRCVDIAHKYGFMPRLSGDMFFSLAGAQYTDNPDIITPEITAMMPENAILGYWDYFSGEKVIDNMMTCCKKFNRPVSFTATVMSWTGFTPHNYKAFDRLSISLPLAVKHDLEGVIMTFWGDDGGECSIWSCLPAWFYAGQMLNGITDMDEIKKRFYDLFQIDFDDFCKLDYPVNYKNNLNNFYSAKPVLYNDPFCGIYDDLVDVIAEDTEAYKKGYRDDDPIEVTAESMEEFKNRYAGYAKELKALANAKEYGYLFDMSAALTELLAKKIDLGVKTREVYRSGDKEALKALITDYDETYRLLCDFYNKFRTMWYKERKGNGFEVQVVRLGGLKERILDCKARLEDLLDGRIDRIEELEEDIKKLHRGHNLKTNAYGKVVTVNTLTHFNFFGF